MTKKLSLKFDPNQQYQLDAIRAVVDLFQGFNFYAQADRFTLGDDAEIIPNLPPDEELYDTTLLAHLNEVQERNGLELSLTLDADRGPVLEGAGEEIHGFPSFTIEMETGTGKTYCYLRTIYELRQRYGFSKFLIVVPSVAIYEGVLKTEQITRSHFRSLYGNEQLDVYGYDGTRLNINTTAGAEFLLFENGERLEMTSALAASKPEVFRAQIAETIQTHLAMQDRLYAQGVKVLSLFFIDRVANYTSVDGVIRRLFDEEFARLKASSPHFASCSAAQVQGSYFAKTKTKDGEVIAINTESKTAAEREAERAAFELIMRDKERLLSFDEPVSFLFAHSALREGWDNPNVFQICTLNRTASHLRKRQEIRSRLAPLRQPNGRARD